MHHIHPHIVHPLSVLISYSEVTPAGITETELGQTLLNGNSIAMASHLTSSQSQDKTATYFNHRLVHLRCELTDF